MWQLAPLAGVLEGATYWNTVDSGVPDGLPEPFADGLSSAMAAAAAAMNAGDTSALVALRAKLAQVEAENLRLRAQGGSGRRRGGGGRDGGGEGGSSDEEDEEEARDRATLAKYEAARRVVMEALGRRVAPTSAQYAERDLHLYRLSDADLQAEYAWHTKLYLADDTYAMPARAPGRLTSAPPSLARPRCLARRARRPARCATPPAALHPLRRPRCNPSPPSPTAWTADAESRAVWVRLACDLLAGRAPSEVCAR